jgi:hypothetical protein
MNEFKESLKVDLNEKEQKEYEEHKRKRYENLIQHPKWENARKRMKEDER